MFGKKKNQLTVKEEITRELTLKTGENLPPAVQDYIDEKFAAMEQRIVDLMAKQLETVARYTSGNQAAAEIAGMEGSGTNSVIDLDAAEEFEHKAQLAAQMGLQLSDPKITEKQYNRMLASGSRVAALRLNRRPADDDDSEG